VGSAKVEFAEGLLHLACLLPPAHLANNVNLIISAMTAKFNAPGQPMPKPEEFLTLLKIFQKTFAALESYSLDRSVASSTASRLLEFIFPLFNSLLDNFSGVVEVIEPLTQVIREAIFCCKTSLQRFDGLISFLVGQFQKTLLWFWLKPLAASVRKYFAYFQGV
jgi:hypothetical protein